MQFHIKNNVARLSIPGIGGLQWKRHLGSAVEVTINEKDETSVEEIRVNCAKNDSTLATCQVGIDCY